MLRFFTALFFGFILLGGLTALGWFYGTEEDRALGLKVMRGIKSVIYEGATLHNPEGNLMPDSLDNDFLQYIKKHWQALDRI